MNENIEKTIGWIFVFIGLGLLIYIIILLASYARII